MNDLLDSLQVGTLVEDSDKKTTGAPKAAAQSPLVASFKKLRAQLVASGHFKHSATFYPKYGVFLGAVLAGAVALVVSRPTCVTSQAASAALLALFWQQLALIAHDWDHNAKSGVRTSDYLWTIIVGNTLGGLSCGWWKDNHNTHHIFSNSVQMDPDIQHMPVMCVSPKFMTKVEGHWSTCVLFFHLPVHLSPRSSPPPPAPRRYYCRLMPFDAAAKVLLQYQHYTFYPIMAVARFNLYALSFIHLIKYQFNKERRPEYANLELVCLAAFWTWFLTLATCLPTTGAMVRYVLISHALSGILHVQICLSHFCMHIHEHNPYGQDDEAFMRVQLQTTLDIECPEWADWLQGGLQFQTTHHLFPRMPRYHLRSARTLVRKWAHDNGLTYHTYGFVEANQMTWRCLRTAAHACRDAVNKGEDVVFAGSMLAEGLKAQG